MTTDRITELTRDDLDAVKETIAATGLFPPELLDGMTADYLGGDSGELWLVAGPGLGVAYIAPERMTDGTWNMLLLAVHPESQRRGTGKAMLAAALNAVRLRGGRLLLVETSGLPDLSGARAFYVAAGFAEEGRIRNFYQAGEDKVIFAMPVQG